MNENFNHIVMTRFNFGLYSPEKYWNYYENQNPELWMEKRLDLFENYCIPSIKKQTNKNFKWIILFDIKTPEKYKERINKFTDLYKPVFGNFTDITNTAIELSKDFNLLITTRIDNDDEMLPNFIKTIQDNKDKCSDYPFFINLDNGYLRNIQTNKINDFKGKSNMFISVVEKIENCKTIYEYGNHTQLKKYGKFINVDCEKLWIWNIHGTNKSKLPPNKKF